MIARLSGNVASSPGADPLIVDVSGVGYAVHIPVRTSLTLAIGQKISVYTHTYVREDALELFGFISPEELTMFHLLLNVSGVGPRTALAVMNHDATAVRTAIASGDVDFFMTVPRLGRKNAQKIIIELRSKLTGSQGALPQEETGETKELTDALVSMGFDRKEIRAILPKLTEGTLEDKLKSALRHLGKH